MFNPSSYYDRRLLNLKSSIYLGSYRRIQWSDLIIDLQNKQGVEVTTNPEYWNLDTPGYSEIYKMWQDANFNKNSIKWTNYYPGTHFAQELVDDVAFYLRLTGVHRSWISRVDSGFIAPWHWDVDDNESAYLEKGPIKRYSVIMGNPTLGHIFILGDDYIYNVPWGSIFKWNNYKEWHSGINAGMCPKFMFHIIGY